MRWPVRGFPLAPYLVSFPCFLLVSLQHPLVSSGNPGETPWNSSFWGGSEPCLRLFWGQNRQNTGYFAGIPGKPRYTWKIPGYRADFLNFAPDFAPDQLSDSGKLASFPRETREKQNGAPNTLWFPWKLPETQSAGDPLVSLWVAGNPRTGQLTPSPTVISCVLVFDLSLSLALSLSKRALLVSYQPICEPVGSVKPTH